MTAKQEKFVEEYLIDLNATQAAIRAGYPAASAGVIANENLKKPNISKKIAKCIAERSKRTGISQDRVILELARIAFVNMNDIVDENGSIRSDAAHDDLSCIESIKIRQSDNQYGSTVETEVKIASKLKALELLGKHLGMWNDKLNVNLNLPVFYEGEDDLEE